MNDGNGGEDGGWRMADGAWQRRTGTEDGDG
jgi:hypothetical protein